MGFKKMSILDSIKKSVFVPIHPTGLPFIIIFCLITLLISWLWSPLFFFGLVLTLWCIYFFRNPNRVIPENIDNNLIVAPADGKIIELEEIIPDEQIGLPKSKYFKIGIFMNVFNVHVNRSPISGTIIKKNYVPGLFFNASLDKASKENERMSLVMNVNGKIKIAFVQIAGLLARRIVNEAQEGDKFKTGEVFGIIRFGSKVDIYIPVGSKINVLKGQTSIAGETVLAELSSKKK
tara:strand:- start:589 stop:1293 length:705 start_codon:yes stop_codon:yes gene_type:complete